MGAFRGVGFGKACSLTLYNLAQRIVSADYCAVRRVIRQELALRDGETVVDLGCGTGNLAGLFAPVRYVGVDLNPTFVAFASRVTRRSFVVMDVTRLGFGESAFDAALAVGLCHHLDHMALEALVGQLRRVCKPGARILVIDITFPPRWNLVERARQRWGEQGKYIRSLQGYRDLLAGELTVEGAYHVHSGFLRYGVLILRAP